MTNKFDIGSLRDAVAQGQIQWQVHALERILERGVSRKDVFDAMMNGEVIEEYGSDKPFPSCLIAQVKGTPLHVVAAIDADAGVGYIITAYRPDLDHFEPDFKTRRSKS